MINKHADGDHHLKQFENRFGLAKEKFLEYKNLTSKNSEIAVILEDKLKKTVLEASKIIKALENDISNLKQSIERQTADNEPLEKELKDNAERLRKHTSDHGNAYMNSLG